MEKYISYDRIDLVEARCASKEEFKSELLGMGYEEPEVSELIAEYGY